MKKVLSIVLGLAAVALVGFVGAVSMQPSATHIERSVTVAASPADVYATVADFDKWPQWNPWREYDPNQKETFSENKVGVGAWYTWEGDQTGSGRQEITEAVADQKIVQSLQFVEPFESSAVVTFTFTPAGDQTTVNWGYDSQNGFMNKAFGLVMDMDAMLGADFQRGLDKLKPLVEKVATDRVAAERAAAEAAALAAAAVPAEGEAAGAQ